MTPSTAVMLVGLSLVVPTVMPVPETETTVWLLNPVPVIVTVVFTLTTTALGATALILGPTATVKQPVHVADPPLVFVTLTLRAPVAASPATETAMSTRWRSAR